MPDLAHDTSKPDAGSSSVATAGALALLMVLTALGQVATNLVVPALGSITDELGFDVGLTGFIISAVLLGIGVGQLIVGPLSDRLGRRLPLLCGLALYVTASLAAMLASSATSLLLARFCQGLGASAGLALPRAIARDRYPGPVFLRVTMLLTLAMAVAPGLAPLAGGLVSQHFGWRAALAISAAVGFAVLAVTVRALPESHHDRTHGGGLAGTVSGYASVLRRRMFLTYALASAATIGGIYCQVTTVQGLYEHAFGWDPSWVACVPLIYSTGFLAGGFVASRLRLGQVNTIRLGLLLITLSAAALLAAVGCGLMSAPVAIAFVMVSQAGVALVMPSTIGLALMAVEGAAGTASAVMGALHMSVGAVGAALVGATSVPTTWALPAGMLGFALLASLCVLAARPSVRTADQEDLDQMFV